LTDNVLKKLRNADIVRLIDEQHVTKTAAAKWYGITKQRVYQIYKQEKQRVQDIRTTGDGENNEPSE
jgi:predicted DNA-binding protein (UPF0251 family)